jgi:hypothetical protein
MERNDEVVERMLATDTTDVDTEAGLARFRERARSVAAVERRSRWLRPVAIAAGVAAMLIAAAATGVADTIFTIFQPKQVAPVAIRTADVTGLPDLRDYGTVTWTVQPEHRQAPTVDAAQRATGITPLRPADTTALGDARIYTITRGEASFKFDEAKLRDAAARAGATAPAMPASIAASTLTVTGGPAVVQSWGGSFDPARVEDLPKLLVAQSKAPVVTSNGATLDELRAFMLAQPGISPQLAQQIRAIGDPASTLLVPIPIDLASGRAVTVRGVQGVLVGDATGLGSALFWVADGIVHVVAGTIADTELVNIANALR